MNWSVFFLFSFPFFCQLENGNGDWEFGSSWDVDGRVLYLNDAFPEGEGSRVLVRGDGWSMKPKLGDLLNTYWH